MRLGACLFKVVVNLGKDYERFHFPKSIPLGWSQMCLFFSLLCLLSLCDLSFIDHPQSLTAQRAVDWDSDSSDLFFSHLHVLQEQEATITRGSWHRY